MHSFFGRTVAFVCNVFFILAAMLAFAPRIAAQGGEPQYFAIRGATVVPVSGPRLENATVIISRGVIKAVAKDATIPDELGSSKAKASSSIPASSTPSPTSAFPPLPRPPAAKAVRVRSRLLRAARRIGLDRHPGAARPTKPP